MRGFKSEDSDVETVTCPGARCIAARDKAIQVASQKYSGWIPKAWIHDNSEVYNAVGQEGDLVIIAGGWSDDKNLERD